MEQVNTMAKNNKGNKVDSILKSINANYYAILNVIYNRYNKHKDNKNITFLSYKIRQYKPYMFNKSSDLTEFNKRNAIYNISNRHVYLPTVAQLLEYNVFGFNTIEINTFKNNKNGIVSYMFKISKSVVEQKYELLKQIVTHIIPEIEKSNNNMSKLLMKKNKIVNNNNIVIPEPIILDNANANDPETTVL